MGPSGVPMRPHDGGNDSDDPVDVTLGVYLGEEGVEDLRPGFVGRPQVQSVSGTLP